MAAAFPYGLGGSYASPVRYLGPPKPRNVGIPSLKMLDESNGGRYAANTGAEAVAQARAAGGHGVPSSSPDPGPTGPTDAPIPPGFPPWWSPSGEPGSEATAHVDPKAPPPTTVPVNYLPPWLNPDGTIKPGFDVPGDPGLPFGGSGMTGPQQSTDSGGGGESPVGGFDMAMLMQLLGIGEQVGQKAFEMGKGPQRTALEAIKQVPFLWDLVKPGSFTANENARLDKESGQGLGILGIPQRQIQRLISEGIAGVNDNASMATRAINQASAANGMYGQGSGNRGLLGYYTDQAGPARSQARTMPWIQAYQQGPALAQTLSGIKGNVAGYGQTTELADLQRQLQAAGLYENAAMGGFGGGVSAASGQADRELQGALANQAAELAKWQTLIPFLFNSPLLGANAQSQASQASNSQLDWLMNLLFGSKGGKGGGFDPGQLAGPIGAAVPGIVEGIASI